MISLLKRREEASLGEFADWYAEHASQAAASLPGLRHYAVSLAVDDEQAFDAVSELTFDSRSALDEALSSEAGEASKADTRANISRREVLIVERREVPVA